MSESHGGVSLSAGSLKTHKPQPCLEGRIFCLLKDTRDPVCDWTIKVSSHKQLDHQIHTQMVEVARNYGLMHAYDLTFAYQDKEQEYSVSFDGLFSLGNAFAKALQCKCTTFTVSVECKPEKSLTMFKALKLLKDKSSGVRLSNLIISEQVIAQLRESDLLSAVCEDSPHLQNLMLRKPNFIEEMKRVEDGGFKILAILLMVRCPDISYLLATIWDKGLSDNNLPFQDSHRPTAISENYWDEFCEEQWHVLPAELHRLESMENLKEFEVEQILPYDMAELLGEGSFGKVSLVTLHGYQDSLYSVTNSKASPAKFTWQ